MGMAEDVITPIRCPVTDGMAFGAGKFLVACGSNLASSSDGLTWTKVGPTPDPGNITPTSPNAVREWCINTAAVDTVTRCAIVNNEDGKCYRWDFATNTLSQVVTLTAGIGEAYTPTLIGPDGQSYAINNAILFALGQ